MTKNKMKKQVVKRKIQSYDKSINDESDKEIMKKDRWKRTEEETTHYANQE